MTQIKKTISNELGEAFSQIGSTFLDKNNIFWKMIDGKWIGKRSVYCHDLSVAWPEDVAESAILNWWCGEDADYSEIFTTI